MLLYQSKLKDKSRELRRNLTDSESVLWSRLRRRQVMNVRFYRQKPIGAYIVDFYAPAVRIVVEVDGSQHRQTAHQASDVMRDTYLAGLGLTVLRFNSREVLTETDGVVEAIYREVGRRLKSPFPPFRKGGKEIPPTPLFQRGALRNPPGPLFSNVG